MYRFIRYAQPSADYRSRWSGLEREINALFACTEADTSANAVRSIPVDVSEDKDNLRITAELPGVQRADLNLEINDEVLSVNATRKVPAAEGEQTVSYGREFNLPYPVQADKITAELKDGVLQLTLPKVEAVKPRRIEVA